MVHNLLKANGVPAKSCALNHSDGSYSVGIMVQSEHIDALQRSLAERPEPWRDLHNWRMLNYGKKPIVCIGLDSLSSQEKHTLGDFLKQNEILGSTMQVQHSDGSFSDVYAVNALLSKRLATALKQPTSAIRDYKPVIPVPTFGFWR